MKGGNKRNTFLIPYSFDALPRSVWVSEPYYCRSVCWRPGRERERADFGERVLAPAWLAGRGWLQACCRGRAYVACVHRAHRSGGVAVACVVRTRRPPRSLGPRLGFGLPGLPGPDLAAVPTVSKSPSRPTPCHTVRKCLGMDFLWVAVGPLAPALGPLCSVVLFLRAVVYIFLPSSAFGRC